MLKKTTTSIIIIGLIFATSNIFSPLTAMAVSISQSKAVFGRLKESVASESIIVQFATPTGIQDNGDTISLTFSSDFTVLAEAAANFDLGLGNSGTCSSATYTDEPMSLTADGSNWGVDVTGRVITFTPQTGDTLAAGYCIRIEMGTAATTGGTGAANTVTNGPLDNDDNIAIAGGFLDTGTISVDIIDDDQVSITATVSQTLSFDLDTGTTAGENGPTYTVAFGTLSASTVKSSGTTAGVNIIFADGATNASGGMNVTVRNANGANGMVSTSVPADKIPNNAAAMATGTANYGLCVSSNGLAGWAKAAGTYANGSCVTNATNNDVKGLTTTAADILTSTTPIATGHAEIIANAEISTATPAHSDYTDTLTFIATASF